MYLGSAILGDLLEAVLAEEEPLVDVAARRVEELVAEATLEAALVPAVVACNDVLEILTLEIF